MYQISAEVIVDGHVTDSIEKCFGFRQIELIRQPDSVGESFYFRVNGIDIFAGGSCWIPADSLLTRVAQKDYREWLALVRNGNQNMIRYYLTSPSLSIADDVVIESGVEASMRMTYSTTFVTSLEYLSGKISCLRAEIIPRIHPSSRASTRKHVTIADD